MNLQPATLDQLARLYQARNEANGRMSAALRSKDKAAIALAKQEASDLNHAYDAARKQYKRQQKAEQRSRWRTTMIKFYLDHHEAKQTA